MYFVCIFLTKQMVKNCSIKEFLYQHLVEQHGEQAGEWAYSLMDGIKRYQKDDFIGLFYDILTGRVGTFFCP